MESSVWNSLFSLLRNESQEISNPENHASSSKRLAFKLGKHSAGIFLWVYSLVYCMSKLQMLTVNVY